MLVGPDCLGPGLHELLRAADGRIDAAVYEVGPSYARLLAEAAARGASVRLLADDHAGPLTGALARLHTEPHGRDVDVRVCRGRAGGRAHWKVVVAGRADPVVAVGTGNLDLRDAPLHAEGERARGTREVWVVVAGHAELAARALAAIEAEWGDARPAPAVGPLVPRRPTPPVADPGTHLPALSITVPTDAVALVLGPAPGAARLLADRLATARRRALVCMPYVHPTVVEARSLLGAMAAAGARGADARLLLGADPSADAAAAGVRRLGELGVRARVMDPTRTTTGHAKVVVVDDALVCGSANWSRGGLRANLEAEIAVDDVRAADWVAGVVDHDWRASGP